MDNRTLKIIKEKNPFSPLHDIICDLLMQEIISFRIQPGTRLVESSLAERFGVSRSPVRTALDMLADTGFLHRENNRFYVNRFSRKEYKHLSDLAALLEPYAAGEAALKLTDAQLRQLYDMAYELQRLYHLATGQDPSDSFVPLMDMEYKFHTFILEVADNEVIFQIYNEYKYRLFFYRSYLLTNPPKEVLDILANDHVLICDTLRLRDRDMAAAIARRHLTVSQKVIEQSHALDGPPVKT